MKRAHQFVEVIEEPPFVGKVITLGEDAAAETVANLGSRFVTHPNSSWWWEHLRDDLPQYSHVSPGNDAYRLLPTICPDHPVLLFVSDDEAPPWLGFRASPGVLADAIAECSGFEYVIADPNGKWLVLENHHGVLVAIGEPVTTNLRRYDA